jgi:hypothetical protein
MRQRVAKWALVFFTLTPLLAAPPSAARAQTGAIPNFGSPILSPDRGDPPPTEDSAPVGHSSVSILDSSVPQNTLRLRFDSEYNMARPTRAEYFMAKGGLPYSPGLPLPEARINSFQEMTTYAEFAPVSFFSTFLETPFRWLNPAYNANAYGVGDINFGFKLCTWNTEDLLATLQVRIYDPTSRTPGLGTHHWTIEPALLGIWRPYDNINVEGDVRYWAPLNGTDFAGDVVRYGLGLSIGQATPDGFWFKPVVEVVGWTVLSGKELVVTAPDAFFVQNAASQTIVNSYLGARLGMGKQLDCYLGYGRCFTGTSWYRDFARVEFRFFY